MIDDMLVFALAFFTLQTKTFSTKYSRYSNLIGGIIMISVGVYLILKLF
jgi:cytochrome c biogenesis protein CcdA